MDQVEFEDHFVDIGGQFLSSSYDLKQKLSGIEAFLFDWDGVFNAGVKGPNTGSNFSEIDSVGVFFLRYAHYRATGRIPKLGIITGADNPTAKMWADRHQAEAVYSKTLHKQKALEHFCDAYNLKPEEVAYTFDDVLDLSVAEKVGMRFCIGRLANPIYLRYVEEKGLADYITASQGDEHAVREICELLLGLEGNYHEVFDIISHQKEEYQEYKKQIKSLKPQYFQWDGEKMITT